MQSVQYDQGIPNSEWITLDEEDPKELPEIMGWKVLVRPVTVKEKTKGGIIMPDSVKDDVTYLTTVGKVLAMGPLCYEDKQKFPNGKWCKVGDYVVYGRNVGNKFLFKGIRLLLINDDQVIMKVKDPKDLDLTYHLSH